MKSADTELQPETNSTSMLDRRKFFSRAGMLGLGAAASGVMLTSRSAHASSQSTEQALDTITEIQTAFLIAEDLATTFYYNGLIGGVIQDPNLAGPGGSATKVTSSGNAGNVDYLRAALTQEYDHANYFRQLLTGSASGASADPYQTFYFPAGTFSTLSSFLGILNALENAFIGAYIVSIQEYATKGALAQSGVYNFEADKKYTATQYEVLAKAAGSILGVESEHRVLGRVISNTNPANNVTYEQLDGLQSIYNGPNSAVAALTPFLTSSTGPGYSLATAIANQKYVSASSSGSYPSS